MRRPRPFSHSPIYINERRERLADVEHKARRELGLEYKDTFPETLHGLFKSVQRHQKGRGLRWNTPKLTLLIFVLIVILISLL